jgi:hypothetical protein
MVASAAADSAIDMRNDRSRHMQLHRSTRVGDCVSEGFALISKVADSVILDSAASRKDFPLKALQ